MVRPLVAMQSARNVSRLRAFEGMHGVRPHFPFAFGEVGLTPDFVQSGLKSKASCQRVRRPVEGEGKCAAQMWVEVSQKRPNRERRDRPA